MTEWEVLLFVCIVGMGLLATIAFLFGKIGDLWLAVADLQDDQRGVVHDKDRGGCYGSARSGKTEGGEDILNSTVWFFVGVLTGSLVATAAILLTVEWLLRRKR